MKGDAVLIQALAQGLSVEEAARRAKVSPRTAYRRRKDPHFRLQVAEARTEFRRLAGSQLALLAQPAVRTLFELLDKSMPPTVRLGAARCLLEQGARFEMELQVH